MIKRAVAIFSFVLLFICASAFAVAKSAPKQSSLYTTPMNGLYAGVAFGAITGDGSNATNGTVNLATGGGGANADSIRFFNNNLNETTDVVFGFHIGFGHVIKRFFYAAAEAFMDSRSQRANSTLTMNQIDNNVDYSINNFIGVKTSGVEYGIRIRPGFLITHKTLLYFVVGWIRSKFDVSSQTTYIAVPTNDSGSAITNQESRVNGLEVGIGVEQSIARRVTIRGQYVYTTYDPINLTSTGAITGAQAGDRITTATTIHPKYSSFLVGLQYYFTS